MELHQGWIWPMKPALMNILLLVALSAMHPLPSPLEGVVQQEYSTVMFLLMSLLYWTERFPWESRLFIQELDLSFKDGMVTTWFGNKLDLNRHGNRVKREEAATAGRF